MPRTSSSSSRSSYRGSRSTYSASSGKMSPSDSDDVGIRYPNGVYKVFHHSDYHKSALARDDSDDLCKIWLQLAIKMSLYGGPNLWMLDISQDDLKSVCGIELDVGSSKNDLTPTSTSTRSAQN